MNMPTALPTAFSRSACIEAREDLLLKSSGSILSEGGQFASGGNMELDAKGAIEISALELEWSRDDKIDGGYDRAYSRENILAELSAGGDLLVDAGDTLTVYGADVKAGGDATLRADGGVTIGSVQDVGKPRPQARH